MEDLTVLIATRDRAASLTETLEGLAAADASGIEVGIRVVDNGTDGATRSVADAFQPRLSVRYLYEPVAGKGRRSTGHWTRVGQAILWPSWTTI